jgi:hypothetical protein
MADVRRTCGSIRVNGPEREDTDDGQRRDSGSPPDVETPPAESDAPPELPGIGPLSPDNPRALGAGVAGLGVLAVLAGN